MDKLQYKDIWRKVLNDNEKIEHEFSVGDKYVMYQGLSLIFIGILLIPTIVVGILLILTGIFLWQFYLKKANAYAFTNKRVLIHRGWLSTNLVSIDYSKITDIKIIEPFIDKHVYKTGSIIINTAGTSTSEIILKFIEHPYEVKKKLDAIRG